MERRSTWQTNRLAIIALVLGVLTFLVSPFFFMLLDRVVPPLEGGASWPNKTIWDVYYQIYIWNGLVFRGSYVFLGWLFSLAGLTIGIISLVRERQKRWMAILAIVLGMIGILAHFMGFILLIMP
jgi:hypothetical protein